MPWEIMNVQLSSVIGTHSTYLIHIADCNGYPVENGCAVLLKFKDWIYFKQYIFMLAWALNCNMFEITPFCIYNNIFKSEMTKYFNKQGKSYYINYFPHNKSLCKYFDYQLHRHEKMKTEMSCEEGKTRMRKWIQTNRIQDSSFLKNN